MTLNGGVFGRFRESCVRSVCKYVDMIGGITLKHYRRIISYHNNHGISAIHHNFIIITLPPLSLLTLSSLSLLWPPKPPLPPPHPRPLIPFNKPQHP